MQTKIFLFLIIPLLCACSGASNHFISNEGFRHKVEKDYEAKKQLFANQHIFDAINDSLSVKEQEAMKFLYAYMPLADVADKSASYYLANIRSSFKAKEILPWGDSVPELLFRHFVLPVRVNNENLDDSREQFFNELKDRVKGLSMKDAALEVNHWCHEKVVYRPTDSRTSSPLASVKTAYGRCGEESTFAVAALRSVGIPARQVYTPRWAHTDDNHAWVEVWVSGKWYFIGACEPEPVLNKAWFNDAAYRAMLMHTKVFGTYNGPEEVMNTTPNYTEINVIENYAPTAKIDVKVVSTNNTPVDSALVEYKIYNYAEFFSVAKKYTNALGQSFLTSGKGDLLVWASKNGAFGFKKVSVGKDKEVIICLNHKVGDSINEDLDIIPPIKGTIECKITQEQIKANEQRLIEEDKIRHNYESSFYTPQKAEALAKELGMNIADIQWLMLASRGNYAEIEKFLRQTPQHNRALAMDLLRTISLKDLRDTPSSVLQDHLISPPVGIDYKVFVNYVMNPRIDNELLTPFRSYLSSVFSPNQQQKFRETPSLLASYISSQIREGDFYNSQRIIMSPRGVWESKIADKKSMEVFFVALARSLGIPSRIDQVTQKLQYMQNKDWVDVNFKQFNATVADKGSVVATYLPSKYITDPKYFSHFSICKIENNGVLSTLNFEEATETSKGDSWESLLKTPLNLEVGHYLLVSGTRMASGKVLAKIVSFNVNKGQTTKSNLVMRSSKEDVQVIGSINPEAKFMPLSSVDTETILSVTGRGYFVLGVISAGEEPSNHALKDIAKYADYFQQWGRKMILLFPSKTNASMFKADAFVGLPNNIVFGIDEGGEIAKMIAKGTNLPSSNSLPIICIADSFGRVVFVSQGYTIGVGEQLVKVIYRL